MNKKYLRDLVPLVAICLVAALLLAIFNLITEGPIAENALRAAQETRTRLLSAAATFEAVELDEGSAMDSCYEGFDANGESVGYVVETTVGGYAGEIVVTVGLDTDNVITGINVGGDNFSETAGLGARAKEAEFTDQFIGETVPLTLQKGTSGLTDGIIDAISGATITSTAVNGGVNSAGKFVMDLSGGGASPNTASVQGFAGPVAVTLSLDDAGAITEITIGDAFFNETEGYGLRALEESFQAQFIGMVPPLTLADIDALAGATITSNAVVNAINQVQAQLSGAVPVAAPAEEAAPVPAAGENAKTGSAQGFAGPVAVAVDLDDTGAITAITIGDENFGETAGFGAKALEDAFKAQFIGKTLPLTAADVDGIAGATITTNAVISALNAIVSDADSAVVEDVPAAAIVDVASGTVLTGSAQGYDGPVAVEITVDENNTITAITIGDDKFAETPGLGGKALEPEFQSQFIGMTLPVNAADVDAIAAATITTNAVIEAINSCVPAAVETASGTVLTGSAQGYDGPVAVEITVDENNTITAITIGDDKFAETPGLGGKALEPEFQSQFIGMTLPVNAADVDAIAAATITTNAVIEAINSCVPAAVETASGTVLTGSAQGYDGPVAVEITVDENNTITAITIGDDKFAETPGLGGKALEPEFQSQFIGMTLPVNAADVDAIAAATITTNAVIEAINSCVPAAEETASGTVLIGSAQGYDGPVAVEITVDENNTITAITIGDENFNETAGLGAKALEPDFQNQFIGMTLPVAAADVDALAYATITTNAVIEAINSCVPAAEETAVAEAVSGTVLTGSAQGYDGPVAVEITVDENNTITAITIGDENFNETAGLGAKALEPDFQNQFIGKTLPVAADDVDALAYATITTNAVIEAINSCVPAAEENAVEEAVSGTVLTGSAQGYDGPVAVEITVDENNTITAITIGDENFNETAGLGAKALEPDFQNQFIGMTLPVAAADVDALAYATITTNAVIEAINSCVPAAEETAVAEAVSGTVLTGSAQGYDGPVAVEITVDENNTITAITIGDENFNETAGLGAKALEPDFQNQFIGKTLPVAAEDVDALAYATITTNAVIEAIAQAAQQLTAE